MYATGLVGKEGILRAYTLEGVGKGGSVIFADGFTITGSFTATTANTKLSDDINPCFDARRVRENCPCVVCIWGEFAPLPAVGNRPRARFRHSPDFGRPLFPRRDSN